jgi:hypothetical protein
LPISSKPQTGISGEAKEYLSDLCEFIFLIAQFTNISFSSNNGMIIPPLSIPSSKNFLVVG